MDMLPLCMRKKCGPVRNNNQPGEPFESFPPWGTHNFLIISPKMRNISKISSLVLAFCILIVDCLLERNAVVCVSIKEPRRILKLPANNYKMAGNYSHLLLGITRRNGQDTFLKMTEGVMMVYRCSTGSNHPLRTLTTREKHSN